MGRQELGVGHERGVSRLVEVSRTPVTAVVDRSAANPGAEASGSPGESAPPGFGYSIDNSSRRRLVARLGVPAFLVVLFALFSVTNHSEFFTAGNVETIVNSQSATLFLALAVTLMLRSGGIDFSLAYNMILAASVVGVLTTSDHVSAPLACVIGLLLAGGIGALNAFLCVTARLNTFIITLGMGTVLTGVAAAVTNNNIVTGLPSGLMSLTAKPVGPNIQIGAIYGIAAAILLWLALERTRFGRDLLIVGGNRSVAETSGLPVARLKYSSFILAGLIAGVAGIVLTGSQGSVDPTTASDYLLGPITASFLGATAIQVGRFNIVGTVIALYLVTVATSGLTLMGVSPWVSQVFDGGALVGAMIFARLTTQNREGHAAASRFTQG
jgi:ribose transport system permease protein